MGGREPAEETSQSFFRDLTDKGKDGGERKETLRALGKEEKMKYAF